MFVLVWIIFLTGIFAEIANNKKVYIRTSVIMYLLIFILVPFTSMVYYIFIGNDFVDNGFIYFKPYLFLTLIIVLYVSKIDLIKETVIILTLLSILTIIIFIISIYGDNLIQYIHSISYLPINIGTRLHSGVNFPLIHFFTSPLIIFPIGYFSFIFMYSKGKKRLSMGLLIAINMVAMFLGGTRNNIIVSIMTPIIIVYWYNKKKTNLLVIFAILFVAIVGFWDILVGMLEIKETSNSIKFSYLLDYLNLYSDSKVLLWGQGMGSSFYTKHSGYVSVTELTYFENVRRFGLTLSIITFLLLLFPLVKLKSKRYRGEHYIFICYFIFLLSCFLQPLLMSSTGMMLLVLVLNKAFSPPINKVEHSGKQLPPKLSSKSV